MIAIVCLDDDNGMSFNKRRQSRDKEIIKDILENADKKIWVNQYSAKLFEPFQPSKLIVEDDFLNCMDKEDYCFVENINLEDQENKMEYIIIYRWNRKYPSDIYFEIDLKSEEWELVGIKEFKGISHDKITKEIYKHKA